MSLCSGTELPTVRPIFFLMMRRPPRDTEGGVVDRTMTEQLAGEHAPAIIERAGTSGGIAESVARTFNRNTVSVGLPDGVLINRTTDDELWIDPLPPVVMQLRRDGGRKTHVQTHGSLELD
mgnify:FL=1